MNCDNLFRTNWMSGQVKCEILETWSDVAPYSDLASPWLEMARTIAQAL